MSARRSSRSVHDSIKSTIRGPKSQPKSSAWYWFREHILACPDTHVERPLLAKSMKVKPSFAYGRGWYTFKNLVYG